jgi:hypothetical protein
VPDCWPNHCWLCTGCTCLCGFVDYSWLHCRGYIFALALCGCRCRFLQCNAMPQPHALVYSYSLLLWSAKGSCFRCCKKLSLEVSEWVWLCCNDQSWICCCHFFFFLVMVSFHVSFRGFQVSGHHYFYLPAAGLVSHVMPSQTLYFGFHRRIYIYRIIFIFQYQYR